MPIKVLLADDSEIVRRAIRQLLLAQTEITIVNEAANLSQAVEMASELDPRVVVMDLHLLDEKTATPQEVKSYLSSYFRIVAISNRKDEDAKTLAENIGAAVLLDKKDLATTLVPTIIQLSGEHGAAA